jgi:single-strand DNA-binding protein
MASFNKVLLLGNLTRDPQLSYLPSQTAVVEFGLAITRKYYGQDKQLKEEVCFVDCRAFSKLAENINKFCKKGNPLFVEGRLTFDSWTAQDGSKRSKHRVTVENMQLLGSPNRGGAPAGAADGGPADEPSTNENGAPHDDIPF